MHPAWFTLSLGLIITAAAQARPVVVNMPPPPAAVMPAVTSPAGDTSAAPVAESLALRRYARARSAPRPERGWGWRPSSSYGWYRSRSWYGGYGYGWYGYPSVGYAPFFFGHHHFPFVHVHHTHRGFRPASR